MVFLLSYPVLCQDGFAAIPNEAAGQYHFDFARNFFASPDSEKAERANYYTALKELESLKGKVATSSDDLLRAFRLYDKALVEFIRHYTYLYLRYAVNTNDEVSGTESSELDAEFSKRTAFLQQELVRINELVLDKFTRQKPALKVYSFAVGAARRYRPHTLSLKEEEALSIASPLSGEWQYDLYQKLFWKESIQNELANQQEV